MTTLHVREDVLRDAVAPLRSVGDITTTADFPHTLTIRVIERRPVAALAGAGDRRIPVTGSGIILRGVTAERDLPSVYLRAPARRRADHRPEDPQRARGRRARRQNRCAGGPKSSRSTTAA